MTAIILHLVAAVVAFVVAYFIAGFAYAELMPFSVGFYFRDRPSVLGFILFAISLAAAVITFWLLS
jgi:hypothetical protein